MLTGWVGGQDRPTYRNHETPIQGTTGADLPYMALSRTASNEMNTPLASKLPMRPSRLAAILVLAFAFGGGSAEVAVRTHRALEKARAEREIGSAGQLVALSLTDETGEVVARPRLICPSGKRAELVLHDPLAPDEVRLALRVAATREPSGEIALDWSLWYPERAVAKSGHVSLAPGVEHAVALGDSGLTATWLAVPVPSAAFDAFLEAEEARRAGVKPT
jgi:hypothetical protein